MENPTRQTIKKKAYSRYNLIKVKEYLAGCTSTSGEKKLL